MQFFGATAMKAGPIEVTTRAIELVAEYFKANTKKPIRLFVKLGGCGIRSFGIALEKPTVHDAVYEIEGFEFIINKGLLEHVAPVKVDSDGFGFRISGSGVSPHSGCGSCGFLCRDGSRCSGDCQTCSHVCAHGRRKLASKSES